jgi:predicted amidohydrolase
MLHRLFSLKPGDIDILVLPEMAFTGMDTADQPHQELDPESSMSSMSISTNSSPLIYSHSGYVFTSKDHIYPYLEDAEEGPSVEWAKTQGPQKGC